MLSPEILDDLVSMGESNGLLRVKVWAPLWVCLERIASRSPEHQIPMEEDAIRRVYELAEALEFPFDLVVDNVDLSTDEIVRRFARWA